MSTILYHLPAKRNLLYSLSRISSYIYLVGRIFGVSSFHLPLIPVHIPEVAALTEIYDDTDDTGEFEDIAETDQIDEDQLAVPDTRGFSSGTLSLIKQYAAFSETLKANSAVGMVEPVVRKSPGPVPETPETPAISPPIPLRSEEPSPSYDAPLANAILAIIPAYNEELSIGTVVLETRAHVDHVIVVDDGSTDKTGQVAEFAGAEVIRIKMNAGKAHALMVGFARAKEIGCNTVVLLDADCQHNPNEIPKVIGPVLEGKADMVIGSRYLDNNNATPAYRRAGQKTLDIATNLGSSFQSTDTQSGFRALSCKSLKFMDFHSDGFHIESDMISRLSEKGLRIMEVAITARYDVPNKHKQNPVSHGMSVLGHIVGLVGYRRPLLSFGVPGIILTVIGIATGIGVLSEYYLNGSFHYIIFFGGLICLILGLLLMTTGLILNSLVQIVRMEKG